MSLEQRAVQISISLPAIKAERSANVWRMGPDAAICVAAGGQDKAGIDREDCEALEKAVRGLLLEQSMRRQRQQASAAEALFTSRREAGVTFSRRKVCAAAGWDHLHPCTKACRNVHCGSDLRELVWGLLEHTGFQEQRAPR